MNIYRLLRNVINQMVRQTTICLFILILSCNLAQATKASLQNIVLDSKNENLTLTFKLEGAFSEQMKEVI
ncbi:MAG: hypothetical protein ACWGQW_16410, partial [bacterium]